MQTNPHKNLILSRFNLASALNQAAHHFDLKATVTENEKKLNNLICGELLKESRKIEELGIYELTHQTETKDG